MRFAEYRKLSIEEQIIYNGFTGVKKDYDNICAVQGWIGSHFITDQGEIYYSSCGDISIKTLGGKKS